jgi:L-lactate dehydrogenase (cytochrome)
MMKKEGWDYYSSGADDEVTLRENHVAFQRIWLKPRVLVNVSKVNMSCKILGHQSTLPLYLTATALGKLAHPDGELAITRAAFNQGVIQMCPTLASYSLEEMMAAKQPGQVQFYQLYVNYNKKTTEEIIRKAEKGGCAALCITVDAPKLGRREKDMRNKFLAKPPDVQKSKPINRSEGTARALSGFIDPSLNWNDLAWFKSITKMPIVLKGIQCAEDAVLAVQHGVAGIILSNHGGRQLDFARSGIEILPEVMSALRQIGAEKKIEVWVDGGVRRGTDIFKAIALGATAVGIGRPILYGLASYGQAGVERVIELFKEEFEMCMTLMGVTSISEINPSFLSITNLSDHITPTPKDFLTSQTYIPLLPANLSKL